MAGGREHAHPLHSQLPVVALFNLDGHHVALGRADVSRALRGPLVKEPLTVCRMGAIRAAGDTVSRVAEFCVDVESVSR